MRIQKKLQSGISLIEVLAAIFVVSIGLLGVLAVIPFGAFQTSKAKHAGYASNMLANAAEEILIREMVKPTSWGITQRLTSGGEVVLEYVDVTITETKTGTRTKKVSVLPISPTVQTTTSAINNTNTASTTIPMLNCTKFLWIEPRDMTDPPHHIFCIGATFDPTKPDRWSEWMRGQDDLTYTAYDDKRPDFEGQNKKIQSSGKYTWFFTYLPTDQREQGQVVPPARITRTATFNPLRPTEPDYDPTRNRSVQIDVDFGIEVRMSTSADPPMQLNNVSPFPSVSPASFPPVPPMNRMPLYPVALTLDPLYVDPEYRAPASDRWTIPTWYSGDYYFARAVYPTVDVDILACYNRVPTDDQQVPMPNGSFSPSYGGGTFTFSNTDYLDLLTQTKYVFVTWGPIDQVEGGAWCKIVFLDKDQASPKIVVTGELPNRSDMYVYIPSGVLYHKQLENVKIR